LPTEAVVSSYLSCLASKQSGDQCCPCISICPGNISNE